jgi:hypothetical protein
MKLITEVVTDRCEVGTTLDEATGKKSHYIEGIFMQGDIKNRNGRTYPVATLEKEMVRYQKDFIDTKRALGELGHPDGPTVNGDRVSHLITEMKRDGSNFVGKARILGTPMGEIVKTFIDEGVQIGVSTRGLGSVKPTKDGVMEVQDDFHLSTVDVVTDPSGPNCFVNGIMENVEYYYDIASNSWLPAQVQEEVAEVIEEIEKEIKTVYRQTVRKIDESHAAELFQRFIESLRK